MNFSVYKRGTERGKDAPYELLGHARTRTEINFLKGTRVGDWSKVYVIVYDHRSGQPVFDHADRRPR